MKKILIALTLVLSLTVSALGCSLAESAGSPDKNDYFTKRDLSGEWKEKNAKTIELSESLTDISYAVFSGCSSLKEINLPVRLERIGDEAFRNCIELHTLEIPASVSRVGKNAFKGCKRLTVYAERGSAGFLAAKHCRVRRRSTGKAKLRG